MAQITHWINGKPWEGAPARTGKVYDPATGAVQSEVALATPEVVDAAVAAAREAFPAWRDSPVTRRQNVMFAYRELVVENRHEIAKLITAEHGKTTPDALGEVQRGLEVSSSPATSPTWSRVNSANRFRPGSTLSRCASRSGSSPGSLLSTSRRWSRCGCTRWPSPPATPSSSSPPRRTPPRRCSARSCSRKPACRRGFSTWCTATRWRSTRILEHPDIQAVSFVGSTPIARYIYENGTKAGKRVQALGGAKNHMVVLARRRHGPGRRCRGFRRLWIGRRDAAWRSRWWWRSAMPPIASSPK